MGTPGLILVWFLIFARMGTFREVSYIFISNTPPPLLLLEFMALQLVYMHIQTQILAKLILQRLSKVVRS